MNIKIGITAGVTVLIILMLLFPFNNSLYKKYYSEACEVQKIIVLDKTNLNIFNLCDSTDGCYNTCGSSCPPSQKTNLIKSIKEKNIVCISLCVPQCVCPIGKKFDNEKGCT